MPVVSYITALHQVLTELMRADERVITLGIWEEPTTGPSVGEVFGPERVIPVPVSEMAYGGAAIGAALAGMRPIVTFSTASFMFNAWEQVINEAPHFRYMSGGQVTVPLVLHCTGGARGAGGAQHSHSPQAMLWNTPGLKLALPATPSDLQGLLKTALADPNPVMIVDHELLYPLEEEIGGTAAPIPLGRGVVRRAGDAVTIVATSLMVHYALAAAEQLAEEGIEVEVIDPRTLVPLDEELILASVAKTGRLVVADESHLSCGVAGEIAARVAYAGFRHLRAPIARVATANVPIPFSPVLEAAVVPGPAHIANAVRQTVEYN